MKHDATGRSKSGRFARLDHGLLSSQAYRSLTPNARSLLVELTMMENGRNNGELFLSVRDAADRMGVADHSAATKAFADLEAAGFIACTREAHFAVKAGEGSRARCWRLTWQSTPCLRMGPTNGFHDHEPEPGSRANKRAAAGCKALKRFRGIQASGNLPVVDFATPKPKRVADSAATPTQMRGENVQDSATRFINNGGNPPLRFVQDSATHIADQLQGCSGELSASGHSKAREAESDSATSRRCERCRVAFPLTRPDQAYLRRHCSDLCRKAAERARRNQRQREGGEAECIGDLLAKSLGDYPMSDPET